MLLCLFLIVVVYLLIPTSNRNSLLTCCKTHQVVYLLIPTSNRNCEMAAYTPKGLYIFLFLHQTATQCSAREGRFTLYIFLFLHQTATSHVFFNPDVSCISSYSYIKPQLKCSPVSVLLVVYLLIPTSNRNCFFASSITLSLYIFLFLHQTATFIVSLTSDEVLYIFLFLHQTATRPAPGASSRRCISSYSYIKPQPCASLPSSGSVVYLLIPTSNRN